MPVTPQFKAKRRRTCGHAVTPRMGQRGRYFEIDRAVKPLSVRARIAAASRWFAMVIAAWLTASVTMWDGLGRMCWRCP